MPFSLIRTVTVGFGISPKSADLPGHPDSARGLRDFSRSPPVGSFTPPRERSTKLALGLVGRLRVPKNRVNSLCGIRQSTNPDASVRGPLSRFSAARVVYSGNRGINLRLDQRGEVARQAP